MAWTEITDDEIATGEPVSSETHEKIKDNLEDLNDRLTVIETDGSNIKYAPLVMSFNGDFSGVATPLDKVLHTRSPGYSIEVTSIKVSVIKAGTSGYLETYIKWRKPDLSWVDLQVTSTTVDFSAGDYATVTNSVINSDNKIIQAGSFISLGIDNVQFGSPDSFIVEIFYKRA